MAIYIKKFGHLWFALFIDTLLYKINYACYNQHLYRPVHHHDFIHCAAMDSGITLSTNNACSLTHISCTFFFLRCGKVIQLLEMPLEILAFSPAVFENKNECE